MKENTVNLARAKGFISVAFIDGGVDELTWLFWLTECNKWLMDVHNIIVLVSDNSGFLGSISFNYLVSEIHKNNQLTSAGQPWKMYVKNPVIFETYPEAFQEGIEAALKLLA